MLNNIIANGDYNNNEYNLGEIIRMRLYNPIFSTNQENSRYIMAQVLIIDCVV